MSEKRRLSDEDREQRRAEDRERLKAAAEQLLTSEGWQRWARVRAQGGLARLSLNNQLLVALARPDATFVAGFKAWLKLGYCVRKGEKAIRIVAPMPIKDRDSDGDDASETRVFFKGISVFDRRQVAPIDGMEQASLEPPCEPLTGDSHARLLEPLAAFARSLGFEVSFESIDGSAGGWCDERAKRIIVDADALANARLRTLIPWRKGRIPTFGMPLERPLPRVLVRAGRSEARRASGDPSERCRSGGGGGGEAGVARPVAGGGAAPVVGGVVAIAEQLAEDGSGDAGGEREQRRGAAGLGVDAELVQAAADALGPDVVARLSAGQQPRGCGLGVQGAEHCGEWVGDLDRVPAEREEDLSAT
jgi:hypothetical protein